MASTDIRTFYFYPEYVWSESDFENFQDWLYETIEGGREGAFGTAVLSGCVVTPTTGLNVDVSAGICVNEDGQLIVTEEESLTFTAPVGNPARYLIVARRNDADMTSIPEPTNPSNSVDLHNQQGYSVVILSGTPNASPTYPATQAGDVVLMGVLLAAAETTIQVDDFESAQISRPRPKRHKLAAKTAHYTVTESDEYLEVNAASGAVTITLPDPSEVIGQVFTIVKVDAVNDVTVDGDGALISGQSAVDLEDQWQTLSVIATPTRYLVV